ncbi:MAG TPA: EAL domain-containing protein [Thermoanaerobaculia bacterium]|nr:EAL domain-containing protein [Thermoanaerobaculia bacterium]
METRPTPGERRAGPPAPQPPTLSISRFLIPVLLCVALAAAALTLAVSRGQRGVAGLPRPALMAAAALLAAAAAFNTARLAAAAGRLRAALAESQRRHRAFFDRTLAGIYRTSVDGRFRECNPALARLLGYGSVEELMGAGVGDLYFDPAERERFVARLAAAGQLTGCESRLRRKDGSVLWILENATWRPAQGGDPDLIEGTLLDITDRKAAESQIVFQAFHDSLSGLPNRALFLDRLLLSVAKARRTETGVAVLLLDLDRFKVITDTLGHGRGDQVLCGVAARLGAMVREGDTVARFGGDEFGFLLQYNAGAGEAAKVAQTALERIAAPFDFVDPGEHPLYVTASIGISLFPSDGADPESLLRSADLAMRRAKELGGHTYQLCTPAMNARAVTRLALESELRRAIERGELDVLYQPVVSFATGMAVGMEALVRWRHPQRGLLPPAQFIPLAEELRLVIPIGDQVLAAACRQLKEWHLGDLPGIRVAVNLSLRHFQDPGLPRAIAALLRDAGLEPGYLDLEITESAAMQDLEQTVATLAALRRLGVRISMDDFGTGQASLGHLKQLPIDCLKIDRDFVRDIDGGPAGQAIVKAIIELGHGLDLTVIAEGVETEAQFQFLAAQGCDEYQGYLASRPLPAEEIEQQLGSGLLLGGLKTSRSQGA